MPYERNTQTQDTIKREIKALQARCVDTYNVIDNSPSDIPYITPENANEKALCYIEGLKSEIENSNTPITTDDNLLTSQFLNEIKEKTKQVEELAAYTKGAIHDVENEINRLNTLIQTAQEVKSRPATRTQEVKPEHLQKAKERFKTMKTELHGLLASLFPNSSEEIQGVLGILMAERLNENSNGYVPVTTENYKIMELLKDLNIVTANPYNNMEIKMAY
ncbi:uncharacterized protein LOC106137432 [Amyelois transitella]|uniref:uncharacterized protein LOC106137432 n=1 Tax=Amyelois transitella TaxID=680683 RepID=UPI00067C54A5|nr:uncharacterized protein LOC106137432 [Amyelois transitella]XP_013193712.1 uncharacterized protein LOC106137432 [Amyelois transitella]